MMDGGDDGSASALAPPADALLDAGHLLLCVGGIHADDHASGTAHEVELWEGKREPDDGAFDHLWLDLNSGGDSEAFSSEPYAVSLSPSAHVATQSAVLELQTGRRSRKRRCEELLRLRDSVAELQRELDALRNQEESSVSRSGSDMCRWHKTAKREMKATARARLENAKLKRSVDAHAAFTESLQQTLSKRQIAVDQLQELLVSHHDDTVSATPPEASSAKESEIYDLLVKSVDARAGDFKTTTSGIAGLSTLAMQRDGTVSDASILQNEEQALCIDLVDQYIIPFDFEASAHVLWTFVLSKVLSLSNRVANTEVIQSTDDLIVTKQSTTSNLMIQDHQFTTEYSATRRICYPDCVDFIWESITLSSGSVSQDTPAIQLTQRGWGKISRLETGSRLSATSVQSYTRLTPTTIDPGLVFSSDEELRADPSQQDLDTNRQQFDVQRLTAHIISGYRLYVASVRDYIESTLMDDMLKCSNPVRRCYQKRW